MNYSVTQGASFAGIAAALSIIIRNSLAIHASGGLDMITDTQINDILTAAFTIVTFAVVAIQRYRKGDVTPIGFKKSE